MLRKLLLPAACALLLGGCVTGYGYGDGGYRGGYYGQPSVRYYGGVGYGSGYGYYPYSRYGYRYGYPYGSSIYYGNYYGGYPYYGYPYYPYYPRRPHGGDGHDHDGDGDHDRKPPWRDWANRIHRDGSRPLSVPHRPQVAGPGQTRSVVGPAAPRPTTQTTERTERRETFRARAATQPRNRSERDIRREQEP